jgi:hypothetical protein
MKKRSQLGQTSVEYILMLSVVAALGLAVFDKLEDYLIGKGPNSLSTRFLGQYSSIFGGAGGGVNLKYKRFPLRR